MQDLPTKFPSGKSMDAGWYLFSGALLSALALPVLLLYLLIVLLPVGDAGIERLLFNKLSAAAFALLVLVAPVVLTRLALRRGRQAQLRGACLLFLRFVLAYLMAYYALPKIFGGFFDTTYQAQDTKLGEVGTFELTWFYFGKSPAQELLIGLLELLPSLLLLFRRSWFTGALLMLPVAASVAMINTFNAVSPITFYVSLVLLAASIYLILSKWPQLRWLLSRLSGSDPPAPMGRAGSIAARSFKGLFAGMLLLLAARGIYQKASSPDPQDFTRRNRIRGGFELVRSIAGDAGVPPYCNIYLERDRGRNTVRTCAPDGTIRYLLVYWSRGSDSVRTFLKLHHDVGLPDVDSATEFNGIFRLRGNSLLVEGTTREGTLSALYRREPWKDYRFYW